MKTIEQIKKELRTEEGLAIAIQEQLCDRFSQWLGAMGYLGSAFTNVKADTTTREWVWKDQYGKKITFRKPYYRDMKQHRGVPIERDRKPEAADSFTINNDSDVPIKQVFDQTYTRKTNASFAKTDAFNFSVTAGAKIGFETGVTGTATNGGAHGLTNGEASFSATFGGEFIRNWVEETGETKSKSIKQELELAPNSNYQLDVYIDKIDLEVDLDVEGVMDFEIEIDLKEAVHNGDIMVYTEGHKLGEQKGEVLKAEGLESMVRNLLGITGGHIKKQARFDQQIVKDHDHLVGILEYVLCPEYRKVKTSNTLKYNDAGKISVEVRKV